MTVRRLLRYAIPIAAFILIGVWLASAPLYRGYSMPECLAAYAAARTRGDTARIDQHPYRHERDNRVRHRCGEVRATSLTDSVSLIPARTP
jgi:hypothetical protein